MQNVVWSNTVIVDSICNIVSMTKADSIDFAL